MIRYNPDINHRRSIRLRGYDYSEAGAYFVTVCTQNRECLFGEIVDGKVILNDAGRMVESIWNELHQHYKGVETDEFVVMPNHFHGIIVLVGAGLALPRIDTTIRQNQGAASSAPTLGDIVRTFKSKSTIYVNRLLVRTGQRLWQRNYYEHIIRTEDEMNRLREYIVNNPAQWALDEENPDCDRGEQSRRGEPAARPYYIG
jgi:REP element-mobilizing transposase RayT